MTKPTIYTKDNTEYRVMPRMIGKSADAVRKFSIMFRSPTSLWWKPLPGARRFDEEADAERELTAFAEKRGWVKS